MLQVCPISFESEKHCDCNSACTSFVLLQEYYHPTVTHRAKLLCFLCKQSCSYCFPCIWHVKIHMKFENLKQSNIQICTHTNPNIPCLGSDSFHSPKETKEDSHYQPPPQWMEAGKSWEQLNSKSRLGLCFPGQMSHFSAVNSVLLNHIYSLFTSKFLTHPLSNTRYKRLI